MSLGKFIRKARLEIGMSQRDLASKIMIDEKRPMKPQHLNDIEHERKGVNSPKQINQFAKVLGLERDYLFFLAGRIPDDIHGNREIYKHDDVVDTMKGSRSALHKVAIF